MKLNNKRIDVWYCPECHREVEAMGHCKNCSTPNYNVYAVPLTQLMPRDTLKKKDKKREKNHE